MSRKRTIKQRINAGFVLAAAFLLVLASNRLNNRNFSAVEHGVDSVFEDRLVVQEYIYRLNNLFHKKELFLAKNISNQENIPQYPEIKTILADFEKTDLTREESQFLTSLKDNYTRLKTLEGQRMNSEASGKEIVSVLGNISRDLDELAEVQLSEGRQMTQRSKRSLGMNQMLSRIEIVFLIIIGILFLVIVFHRDKSKVELVE
ncbi:MCP four helix bundle domain-containing protein [Flagellimonas okinawensis]|uniref:MCP four helix bundle domain-containing protein n=1 Tax=Flagellimonas okinawensis TaxID=3031324 RepID=A0ABT5XM80_9FLAO|nr:MCP four helix bundle domain-containing protein [[Muricauda] okinawensis]MDF0706993.1 MCP four helix bundle domain-containing protein [[Muricauda] okinawensis]